MTTPPPSLAEWVTWDYFPPASDYYAEGEPDDTAEFTSEGARKAWLTRKRAADDAAAAASETAKSDLSVDIVGMGAATAEVQQGIDLVRKMLPNARHHELTKVVINTWGNQFGGKSKDSIYVSKDFLDDEVMAKRAADFGNTDPAYPGRLITGTSRSNVITHEYNHILDGQLMEHPAAAAELDAFLNEQVPYVDYAGNVTMQRRRDNPQHSASIYALENRYEYVAEGLTDAMENGDRARPDSKALLDIFRRGFDSPRSS